jgi:hypothetical protein
MRILQAVCVRPNGTPEPRPYGNEIGLFGFDQGVEWAMARDVFKSDLENIARPPFCQHTRLEYTDGFPLAIAV